MKTKYIKMQVGNGDNDVWTEQFVLHTLDDGSCVGVAESDIQSFENGWEFETSCWSRCRKIPEPKKRPMITDEVTHFLCSTLGIAVRVDGEMWRLPGYFKYTKKIERYEWCLCTADGFGDPHSFEVEDDS